MSASLTEIDAAPITQPPTAPRRWPVLALVVLGVALYFAQYAWVAAPEVVPAMPMFMASFWGPLLCTVVLGIGWLVRGPAPWLQRLACVTLLVLFVAAFDVAAHSTARFFLVTKGVPAATGLAVLFWCFSARLPARGSVALSLAFLALVPWQLIKFNGVTGHFGLDPQWRWRSDAETAAALFDENHKADAPGREGPMIASATDWPGFRGARQDGAVTNIDLGDWQTAPKELWRRPVGPGWSSCCVIDDRIFTQEQRGDQELVVCYNASTGTSLWAIGDPTRYSDTPSGVGPRGTPAFHQGKVYTFGATGILNCLEAASGKRLWRVDLRETLGVTSGPFGLATSPLVVGDLVLVHPGSPTGPRLVAYRADTGKQEWSAGTASVGYSTPHLAVLAGVPQILVFNGDGLFAHDRDTGKELWAYEWKAETTAPICVQPMLLSGDRIVLGAGRPGIRSRCIKVVRKDDTWQTEKVWESAFAPAFNDVVSFGDNLYALDGGRLACIDANTGKRRWKEGHYGSGQLLRAGNRLLVQDESGRLVLIDPTTEAWHEVGEVAALSDKTWNHPVIANGRLFVRNACEMVCYQLHP